MHVYLYSTIQTQSKVLKSYRLKTLMVKTSIRLLDNEDNCELFLVVLQFIKVIPQK